MPVNDFNYNEFYLRKHLNINWLRPESALWDAIAARCLSKELMGKEDILEIGIGNGFFSFLMLGGSFSPDFDWYYSVNTNGFWENSDIYDYDSGVPIDRYIESMPETRIKVGVDHKNTLLNQAARLGYIDNLILHDCNLPLSIDKKITTIYSNIFYWLKDPIQSIHEIGNLLPPGGEIVAVFPNSTFYKECTSYNRTDKLSVLINRGRVNLNNWHMDLADFEKEIKKRGVFELKSYSRYLSPLVLKIWDIGLRPLSIPLIKMANSLSSEIRLEIKDEWCNTIEQFAFPLLENEMEFGHKYGGYNLVVLKK